MPFTTTVNVLAIEFLAPMAGIIGAAIALPALLALYFLKLRRRPVRVSSTLLWEQSVADLQVNAPFRMIRPSWILFFQVLALACLLMAMARPAIDRPASGSRVVVVVDASASMSARDTTPMNAGARSTDVTRLERAKDEARRLIDRLPDRTEVLLIALGAQARVVTPFTRNHQQVRQAIATIEPTDQPADLDDALRVVSAFTKPTSMDESSPGSDPPRVILVSDGSFAPPGPEGRSSIGNATLEFIRIGPEKEPVQRGGENIGIVAIAARRDYEDPALVRLFVRMQSSMSRDTSVGLSQLLNGQASGAATLTVQARTETAPSEVTHRFEVRNDAGGVVSIVMAVDDVLKADDRASIVLDPPGGPAIAIVRPDADRTVGDAALYNALATLNTSRLEELTESTANQRGLLGQNAAAFALFDLVVYNRVRPVELPPVATMSFGATVPIPGLSVVADESARPTEVAFWARAHPVMRYVTLSDVIIDRPMRMTLPSATNEGDSTSIVARELASGAEQPLIVLIERAGVRRLIAAFSLDDTNWWRDLSFPTFMANGVDFLSPMVSGAAGRAFTTAEAPVMTWPGAAPGNTATLMGPDGFQATLRAGEDGRATPGMLSRAGVYRIEAEGGAGAVVAVNLLDPIESAAYVAEAVDIGSQIAGATDVAGVAPIEIWWWFIVAALFLTTLEWLLFAGRLRT